jgi:hypothetical protein
MSHLLLKAAEKGDIKKIEERLAAGDNIEYRDKGTGRTALLCAVVEGHKEAVLYLLDKGADMNAYCKAVGHNSLEWAAAQDDHELVKLLIEKGADPNFRSDNAFLGRLPLMIAAQKGNLEIVKTLLAAGADPGAQDARGESALHLARSKNRTEVIAFLEKIDGADPALPLEPKVMPWPPVDWESPKPLYAARETIPIPGDASPAQIVRGYIFAMHRWESNAYQASSDAEAKGQRFDLDAAIAEAHKIQGAYCTNKKRIYTTGSVGYPPKYQLGLAMLAEEYPKPARCEILTRNTGVKSGDISYEEILFVLLRKQGAWRIDSAKTRLVGEQKWDNMIL